MSADDELEKIKRQMMRRMMAPVIHRLATEYKGKAYIAQLDVDHNRGTAMKYRVMSIPNFMVFRGGQPVGQTVGAVGKPGLVQLLQLGLG